MDGTVTHLFKGKRKREGEGKKERKKEIKKERKKERVNKQQAFALELTKSG